MAGWGCGGGGLSQHFPTAAKQQASFTTPLYRGSRSSNVPNQVLITKKGRKRNQNQPLR